MLERQKGKQLGYALVGKLERKKEKVLVRRLATLLEPWWELLLGPW
jgi:hypothetical protein